MKIKDLREKLGWSREKMASEIGVSYFTLQNWELGQNEPSFLAQEKINMLLRKVGELTPDPDEVF